MRLLSFRTRTPWSELIEDVLAHKCVLDVSTLHAKDGHTCTIRWEWHRCSKLACGSSAKSAQEAVERAIEVWHRDMMKVLKDWLEAK